MGREWKRLSVNVSDELYEQVRDIPRGLRASMVRIFLEKAMSAAQIHGNAAYGAILDGEYDLIPRFKHDEAGR